MLIEVSRKSGSLKPYDKATFAQNMKCNISLINDIDDLTKKLGDKLGNKCAIDNNGCLVGNIPKKYCGRWYGLYKQIWVGLLFDNRKINKQKMNYLTVGFCVYDPYQSKPSYPKNQYTELEAIIPYMEEHPYYIERARINNSYWFFIILENSLSNSFSNDYTETIKEIILKTISWRKNMSTYKNLYFTRTLDGIVHSAYTVKADSLNPHKANANICKEAFKNDSTIECLLLEVNVASVAESAFENCKELQIVEYTEGDELLANENEILANDDKGNIKLTSSSNISIQFHAFKNCEKLHTVVFPKLDKGGQLTIEKEAFFGCKELRTVVLMSDKDASVEITEGAFMGCDFNKLVFVVSPKSTAEQYAREHGIRFVYADNVK